MSSYAEICADNRYLYGHLEACALELKYSREHQLTDLTDTLTEQYKAFMALININLEQLEAYCRRNYEMYLPTESELISVPGTLLRKQHMVIAIYKENPNLTMREIAVSCSIAETTVSRILSAHYRYKFKEAPA